MTSVTGSEPEVGPLGGLREVALVQPDRVAITHGDVHLTFGELDSLVSTTAAALANAIEGAPLPPGSFVPAFMTHDIQSVILIHAAFWVGVPIGLIDPSLPQAEMAERLAALGSSGVALIPNKSFRSRVPPDLDVVIAASEPAGTFDPRPVDPDRDSSVAFSSGTTGRAKGVVHSRRVSCCALAALEKLLDSGMGRGPIASIGPFHWTGGFSVPLQLCNGSSMAIVTIDGGDAGALLEGLRTARVESVILTPSLAMWMARSNPGPPLADLKVLALGGEVLLTTQVAEARKLLGLSGKLRVIWGASEVERIHSSEVETLDRWGDVVPIELGPNATIRLESSDDDPEPVHGGRVGEIIARGDVASRYLGQPELTDLRFGVDPDGVRFWRSGDLAEQLPDGTLFLRGRMDDMVKINGKLVEPAESLALLRAYPGLRAVEVLPHTYGSGRVVLVAHVVADDGVSPDAIRQMLMDRLPIHVIPGVLMRHEDLPLTDRGKADRQALQKMRPVAWLETEAHAPEAPIEKFLLGQLQAILESDDIGIDDDFWFLGLDSLGAVELVAAIGEAGLGELPVTALLEQRTIRSLAWQLGVGICEADSDIVTFNADVDGDPVFCMVGAGSTAIDFQHLAKCYGSTKSLVVVEARGTHTRARPDRTIASMARRVLAAIDERQPSGTVILFGYSAGGFVAWEVAQRLVDRGRDARVVLLDTVFVPSGVRLGLNIWRPPAPGMNRFRRFTRSCRSRVAGLKQRWREFRPGPPRADVLRYVDFEHIMMRAVRHYDLSQARFPVLYIEASRNPLPVSTTEPSDLERWRAVAPDLAVIPVEGDHHTMIEAPFGLQVASTIAEWLDSRTTQEM